MINKQQQLKKQIVVNAHLDCKVGLKVGFSVDDAVGVDDDRSAWIARITSKA